MRLTNKAIQREYRRLNKTYFKNELPKDIKVKFDIRGELDPDTYAEYSHSDKEILLHEDLRKVPDFAYIVLMHEMAHVKVPDGRHGFEFVAVINCFYQMGA